MKPILALSTGWFMLRGPSVGILGTHFFADYDRRGWVLLESAFFFSSPNVNWFPRVGSRRGGMGGKIYHNSKQGLELEQNSQIEICHYLTPSPPSDWFSDHPRQSRGLLWFFFFRVGLKFKLGEKIEWGGLNCSILLNNSPAIYG